MRREVRLNITSVNGNVVTYDVTWPGEQQKPTILVMTEGDNIIVSMDIEGEWLEGGRELAPLERAAIKLGLRGVGVTGWIRRWMG